MKNINRLLAAAAILLSAAACHTSEIDNPGHTDPVNPGEPGLTISASIVKTRVTYSDMDDDMYDKGYLDQQWEEGDILFGYYGGAVTNKVILKVDGFDEYGDAILKPVNVEGVASLSALAKLDSTVPVDLVYTGKNVSDYTKESDVVYPFDINDGTLTVNMDPQDAAQDGVLHCAQDGVRIPACMHARAFVETDKNDSDKKSLFFTFVNDCAIIEICSLTGIKNLGLAGDVSLTSLTVSNLVLNGKYTFGDNGFELEASEFKFGSDVPQEQDYIKSFGSSDKWCVDKDGNIYYDGSTEKRYLIAVVPNNYLQEIEVSAKINDANSGPHTFPYGSHSFESGMCYVIYKEEVVAKTVDGVYFSTVAAAFDHADTLNVSNNIVTLVKESIVGLGVSKVDEEGNAAIHINYKVTLDLNGCTLSLADVSSVVSECFYVDEYSEEKGGGHLTIKDSRSGGTLKSDAGSHLIMNEGQIIVESGIIRHNGEWCAVRNYEGSELTIKKGELYSEAYAVVSNDGTVTINGGAVHSNTDGDDEAYNGAIINCGLLTINGGRIYSMSEPGVANYFKLIVNSGVVYSKNSNAIYAGSYSNSIKSSVDIVSAECLDASGDDIIPNIYTCNNQKAAILVTDSFFDANGDWEKKGGAGTDFNMRDGLVCSNYGAVDLQGNVSGEISGGQLEGDTYCALAIGNGANITVSGGHFFIKKNDVNAAAAVRAYNASTATNTSLIITAGDDEPLIYADGTTNVSIDARLFTYNSAKIYLKGGYYYSNTDYFYRESRDEPNDVDYYNLQTTDFGNFYSNKSKMELDSNTYVGYDLSAESGNNKFNGKVAKKLTPAKKVDVIIHKIVQGDDGTYNMVQDTTKSLEFIYHITTPNGDDQQESGMQSYHFNGFSW